MSHQYPTFPEGSRQADQEAYNARLQQPPSIKTAVMLMRVGAGLALVGLVVTLLTLDAVKSDLEEQLRDSEAAVSQSTIDSTFQVAIIFAVVISLIGVALWLWMASANGKGKSWARVVATVLGVINALLFVYALTVATQTVASLVIGAATLIVGVTALVFLYRSDSSAFYAANSRR